MDRIESKFKDYLSDLGKLISEESWKAIHKQEASKHELKDYDIGYLMAMYFVVTLMKSQGALFEISDSEMGLDKIEESDFLK